MRAIEGRGPGGTAGRTARTAPGPFDERSLFAEAPLVEWVTDGPGSGGFSLGLAFALRQIDDEEPGGTIAVVDVDRTLHPPALVGLGLDLDRVLVVRPKSEADVLWVAEHLLRCRGIALTLLPVDRLRSQQGRRLQLAAEVGGGRAVLLRPWRARREACWTDLRLLVEPLPTISPGATGGSSARAGWASITRTRPPDDQTPDHASTTTGDRAAGLTGGTLATTETRRWRVEVAYRRGATPGDVFEVHRHDETGRLHLVSELAAATSARRAS